MVEHAGLPDAGRVSHFEIDDLLPTAAEKAVLGAFDGFANPTASVGLAAVNGVATTAIRSDGAPALDQGIVPTWTGLHTFEAAIAVETGAVGTVGVVVKAEAGQTANLQEWQNSGGTALAWVTKDGQLRNDIVENANSFYAAQFHINVGAGNHIYLTALRTTIEILSQTITRTGATGPASWEPRVFMRGVAAATEISAAMAFYDGRDSSVATRAYGYRVTDPSLQDTASIGTFYGFYADALTAAGTNYAIYCAGGNSYHAGRFAFGGTVAALAQVHVDQSAAGGAIPVLLLDQADLSEEFIDLVCATTGAGDPVDTVTAVGANFARLRVAVNGVFKYVQLYNA